MIAYTSRLASKATQDALTGLQREVWEAIRDWPADDAPSLQDLAAHLHRKECSICGRLNELHRAGAIQDAPLKRGLCGIAVKTYRALVWHEPTPDPAQLSLL